MTADDTRTLEEKLQFIGGRREVMQALLPYKEGVGLEVAPNWAPLVTPNEGKVYYCDRLTFDELVERERTNQGRIDFGVEVLPLDFVWRDGFTLEECAPPGMKFDYVASAHVLEHVPNFLEFLYQMRAVTKDDGLIAFVLPDVKGSGECFRRETSAAELLGSFLTGQTAPSPGQVYDALKQGFAFENRSYEGMTLADVPRYFTDRDAAEAAARSLREYVDVHCWSFSAEGFAGVMTELQGIGYFDFDIVDIRTAPLNNTGHPPEFYVALRPNRPARPSAIPRRRVENETATRDVRLLTAELEWLRAEVGRLRSEWREATRRLDRYAAAAPWHLAEAVETLSDRELALVRRLVEVSDHGDRAFREAVAAQDLLKVEKAAAESRLARLEASPLVRLAERLGLI